MYAAVLCWLAFRNKYYPKWYLAGIIVYTAYAIGLIFWKNGVIDWISKHDAANITETMKTDQPWIEETREFFGLVILIIVLLVDFFYAKRLRTKMS
jgi:hypothetical protein